MLLNPNAFTPSVPGTQGNTGRNAFRGPGLYNVDISLSRSFPQRWLGEGRTAHIRADVCSISQNHSNLNNPQALINQPDFGVATYMDARNIQGLSNGFPATAPLGDTSRQVITVD